MTPEKDWYVIDNVADLDTPAVAIYPDRVSGNIKILVASIDDVARLRPHVKTHKSAEVSRAMMDAGIQKFKCATIAEAEMLASVDAPDVLLAYQPVGPKGRRLATLIDRFPHTRFSCLIDNYETAVQLSILFTEKKYVLPVFIDLNVGMNRTGILPAAALLLFERCQSLKGISIVGIHAYDGHLRDSDIAIRKQKCDEAFKPVLRLQKDIQNDFNKSLIIVAGGTPTYPIHCRRDAVECSPGTYIYWDTGYAEILKEQSYLFAALVITRVISIPNPNTICIDLGHKAIASENPLVNRVEFLNASGLTPIGHSEEHMVLRVDDGKVYAVGDIFYGVPYHVCPTIALHQQPAIVINHRMNEYWNTLSRSRMITI